MVHTVLTRLHGFLAQQQFLLLFLIVGLGCLLGRLKIKGFGLGATAATIVLGLVVSAIAYLNDVKIQYPDILSNIFFYLFIFAVGLRIGPQFWFGLKQAGVKLVVLGLIASLLGPLLAFTWARLFHLSGGMMVGLLGGATTNTPTLGGAQSALASGVAKMQGTSAQNVAGNLSTAFAITYVFGMASFLLFQKFVPKIFRTNIERAARDADKQTAGGPPAPGTPEALTPAYVPAEVRAYRVENQELLGHPLATLRQRYPRGAVLEIERAGKSLAATDELVLERGDEIAVAARIEVLVERARLIGPEVTQRGLRAIPMETAEVVVTRPELAGKTLEQLVHGAGHGLCLDGLFRAGDQVPATAATIVRKGDVLRVTGEATHIAALADAAGAVSRADVATDIVFLAVGLAIGALLGAIEVPVGNVKISLGIGGGLLLTGLFISVWRTRRPNLGGPFPEPARRLIEDLGLNIFVAIIGLNAGAKFLEALKGGTVLPLLAGAIFIGLIPPIAVWLIGRYALKLNPAILLGAMAGARTNSPGLRVAQEEACSTAPAIGFPVPFAIGTILLTIAGYVLMVV